MSKVVQVKQCDIIRGECGYVAKCALARALNRTFKQKGWTISSNQIIRSPYNKAYRTLARDSDKVNRFLDKFDSRMNVRPIKFSIFAEKDW